MVALLGSMGTPLSSNLARPPLFRAGVVLAGQVAGCETRSRHPAKDGAQASLIAQEGKGGGLRVIEAAGRPPIDKVQVFGVASPASCFRYRSGICGLCSGLVSCLEIRVITPPTSG